MGLKDFLQGRRDDTELGQGIWRRDHDRFVRGLDRFHQILERLHREQDIDALVEDANALADLLPRVRSVAAQAQKLAPSNGHDIPASQNGTYSDLNRALAKAGNNVALCAEALAMTRCKGDCSQNCQRKTSVARRVEAVVEQVEHAENLIEKAALEAHLASNSH